MHNMVPEHMEEIVNLTFQYIRVLQQQGVSEWMFDEVRVMPLEVEELCFFLVLMQQAYYAHLNACVRYELFAR